MISINTNLSSLIAQSSMKKATFSLNQAVERMTTGFKINQAKDNAANYSISQNMTTKINSYMVAQDNVAMGLDMLTTAEENLNLISDKLTRLRDLATQASNGTYGEQSLNAINAEANALVDEIERLYNTTEYNGINLAKGRVTSTEESKFIKDIDRRDTSKMTKLSSVAPTEKLELGCYSISTADELAQLATMTNNGLIGENTEFVLANDIDLEGWCNAHSDTGGWVRIGYFLENGQNDCTKTFKATFDGNGYKISNLKMTATSTANENKFYFGLFGFVENANIKNLAITDANIGCDQYESTMGIITGYARNSSIDNCIVLDANLNCYNNGGLIVGNMSNCTIKNCYTNGDISVAYNRVGGIAGTFARNSIIENCYSLADISEGWDGCTGGLVGFSYLGINSIINSAYFNATNNVNSTFVDYLEQSTVVLENCYCNDLTKTFVAGVDNNVHANSNIQEISDISECFKLNKKVYDFNPNLKLQIGTKSDINSQIGLDTGYSIDGISSLRGLGLSDLDYTGYLDKFLSSLSSKQTEFGAVQNRLESALDEIETQYNNLVSSRTTLRDADIAEESSAYIRQQILQEASATLLATANQSPSIALQLI